MRVAMGWSYACRAPELVQEDGFASSVVKVAKTASTSALAANDNK
jgi:hypothetical protein